jgi:translation elongation factor EF-4
MKYTLPHVEIISNFFDELKSLTSGYARLFFYFNSLNSWWKFKFNNKFLSFDYENIGYVASNLVKLSFSLNNTDVDELTQIVHASRSQSIARRLVEKLKMNVPRQLYKVAVQAKLGSKIIASETIKPYRTDVTQHLVSTRRLV